MLDFNAERHEYRWNGAIVPSVTQVIRAALGDPFGRIPADVLERKRKIGQAAHRACELDSRGDLDEATVHPAVLPYLQAWQAFVRESGFVVVFAELPFRHDTYGYAGTPDFVGDLNGNRVVCDVKTGLSGPQAALQTAAYSALVCAQRRFALRALPDGRYKLVEFSSPGDWPDFLACLRCVRLRERIANE